MALVKWTNDDFDVIGFLAQMLDDANPKPAAEQFNDAYTHGGGWHPLAGWVFEPGQCSIKYPGDDRLYPTSQCELHGDHIYFYIEGAWVCIVHADNSYEVARMD